MSEIEELMKTEKITNSSISFAPTPRGNEPSQIILKSAIFGEKNEIQAIQDSVIKVRPSAKTLLLQQVEAIGKIISQVLALETIAHYRPQLKEHAQILLQEEVFTQLRSLHYLNVQFLQQQAEFAEARKLQISKVQLLVPLLPNIELQNVLKLFISDQHEVSQNLKKVLSYIESQKNYHCVLVHDQTGQELLKLIKNDSREIVRDLYFQQETKYPQLRELWRLLIVNGVQQNKLSQKQLKEFIHLISSDAQIFQEVQLVQTVFEELNVYLGQILKTDTQINELNNQQIKTLRLLYDGMGNLPQSEFTDFAVPETIYPILVNTSLLINNSTDDDSRLSLIDQIEGQLQKGVVKFEVKNFILFSELFLSSQLQLLMLAYAEYCKSNQQIDPELFQFRTILPSDQKTFERLLSMPTDNEQNQIQQLSEVVEEAGAWFQLLDRIAMSDTEQNRNALNQHIALLIQSKHHFDYHVSLLEQLIMFEKVQEYAFEQILLLAQNKTLKESGLKQQELMNKKINFHSLLKYYKNSVKKERRSSTLIAQIDPDYADDFQDLLAAIYSYNEHQQEQFLNAVRQVYKQEFKTQLEKLKEDGSNQIQQAIKLIFQKMHT